MTDYEELYILEAIQKMNCKLPRYKKVYLRYPIEPYDSVPESFDEVAHELYPHEELHICNDLSLEEWDQIEYDLETRTHFFFTKYSYK